MGVYKLLKDEEFKALDTASRVSYYYENFYRYPSHRNLTFMTLYHLKDVLTNRDIMNIIEWHKNGKILKRYSTHRKKSVSIINWDIDQETRDSRCKLIAKELSFRNDVINKYKNKIYEL